VREGDELISVSGDGRIIRCGDYVYTITDRRMRVRGFWPGPGGTRVVFGRSESAWASNVRIDPAHPWVWSGE
jgi:hypothetical protein